MTPGTCQGRLFPQAGIVELHSSCTREDGLDRTPSVTRSAAIGSGRVCCRLWWPAGRARAVCCYGWVAGLARRGVLLLVVMSVSWLVSARSWASSSR